MKFSFPKFQKEHSRKLYEEEFTVRGLPYCKSGLDKLKISNPDYRASSKKNIESGLTMKKIYQYSYVDRPVKLVPEPRNKADKNAIMVLIAGEKVGYVPAELCSHFHHVLKKGDIKYITAHCRGGNYKVVSANGDAVKLDEDLSIIIRIGYAE